MSMDVMMSAPVAGAPSSDTPFASCAPSADAADAFAALLHQAAGKGTDAPGDPSDHDEAADDVAAMVAASLMTTIVPLTTPIVVKAGGDAAAPPSESEAVSSIDSAPPAS